MSKIPNLFAAPPTANTCWLYNQLHAPAHDEARRVRDYLMDLWQEYYPYCQDLHFLSEFPLHLHDRWFEMYLTVHLVQGGAEVQRQTGNKGGPDVLVMVNGRKVWIEAACATGGAPGLPDSIPALDGSNGSVWSNVPTDKIAVRIRSAVEGKKKKYDCYLADGIVQLEDTLLIALNVEQVPYAALGAQRYIFRSMYGVGHQVITINRQTLKAEGLHNEELEFIPKLSTGRPVGTQPFTDGSMTQIAGIIVSGRSAMACAEDSLDPLTLYPNLTAQPLWTPWTLPVDREWQFANTDEGWTGTSSTQ